VCPTLKGTTVLDFIRNNAGLALGIVVYGAFAYFMVRVFLGNPFRKKVADEFQTRR